MWDRQKKYIYGNPGEHFNALTRRIELAPGQVQYHVRKLQKQGEVVGEPLYGRTHYFPLEYEECERCAIAVLKQETARDILLMLVEDGPSAPARVAEDIDIARSTLEWYLDHLEEQALVTKQRDDGNRVTLVVPKPTETVRLLDEINPPLQNRLLDRFTRLVDLLSESRRNHLS